MFSLRILRSLGCLALVAAITWAAFSVLHVNALIVGFAYVLIVLVVAAQWGFIESLVTSLAAMLCLNYFFLPPILSLTITDPQNWVALSSFMVTAVTASQLSASVRKRAAEAQARRIEVERLYQLSLSLMLVETTKELGPQIASNVREHFGFMTAAFCDRLTGEVHISGSEDSRLDLEALRAAAEGKSSWSVARKDIDTRGTRVFLVPVALGGRLFGSLGLVGPSLSAPALQAISNLAAVALEHANQQIAFGRLEVARQNERLRSMLLDALAHDFLTPLTAIKTAISTARTEYTHDPDEEELLEVAEEEADKLGEMTNEITDMGRIEPGKPRIKRRKLQVEDLLRSAVDRMKYILRSHPVQLEIAENLSPINADPEMIGLALRQLIGNAAKYSPPESKIEITCAVADNAVIVRVRDHGPGIPGDELGPIFERYYRGKLARETVAGTGMGLSIARDIIRAHHGRLWAENAPEGGAQFSFAVPIYHEGQEP